MSAAPTKASATVNHLNQPGLRIPFHIADVGEEEARAVAEVVRSGWLTMGPRTFEFEQRFAAYVGAKHAVAVNSCTAALHLALDAIGLQAGDEVLLPTTTFTATAEVVAYFGARPVLVDVDPVTMNMDPGDAERRVTLKTKAIIPVHLGGQPCDMQELRALADRHDLLVIEDAAHAIPASYRGVPVGAISHITAFSFYATKTLTTGEGGMLTTDNDLYADRMRIMRLHGISRDAWKRYTAEGSWYYEVIHAGFKYNTTDMNAAIGLVQLAKCDRMAAARRSIAQRYSAAFALQPALECPTVKPDRESAWHLYILRLRPESLTLSRNQFIDALRQRGIGTSVHFIPLHLHPFYADRYGYRPGDLPNSERQYARCLSLPMYPSMSVADVNCVIDAVREIAASASVA